MRTFSVAGTYFIAYLATARGQTVLTDSNVNAAVTAWFASPSPSQWSVAYPGVSQDMALWDVGRVTSMNELFDSAANTAAVTFNEDLSAWNTGEATNMDNMFRGAAAFNADVSKWSTEKVTTMVGVFTAAAAFNADVSKWSTVRWTSTKQMFDNAVAFNADVSKWSTGAVTDMYGMFHAAAAFNADVSKWSTGLVTDMENLFMAAAVFNADLSKWNTGEATTMDNMFRGATAFNADVSKWSTGKVTAMNGVFRDASSFNADVSKWSTGPPNAVTNMQNMFMGATAFNVDVSKWNTAGVQQMGMMFFGASKFTVCVNKVWDLGALAANGDSIMFMNSGTCDCSATTATCAAKCDGSIVDAVTDGDCGPGAYATASSTAACAAAPCDMAIAADKTACCTIIPAGSYGSLLRTPAPIFLPGWAPTQAPVPVPVTAATQASVATAAPVPAAPASALGTGITLSTSFNAVAFVTPIGEFFSIAVPNTPTDTLITKVEIGFIIQLTDINGNTFTSVVTKVNPDNTVEFADTVTCSSGGGVDDCSFSEGAAIAFWEGPAASKSFQKAHQAAAPPPLLLSTRASVSAGATSIVVADVTGIIGGEATMTISDRSNTEVRAISHVTDSPYRIVFLEPLASTYSPGRLTVVAEAGHSAATAAPTLPPTDRPTPAPATSTAAPMSAAVDVQNDIRSQDTEPGIPATAKKGKKHAKHPKKEGKSKGGEGKKGKHGALAAKKSVTRQPASTNVGASTLLAIVGMIGAVAAFIRRDMKRPGSTGASERTYLLSEVEEPSVDIMG